MSSSCYQAACYFQCHFLNAQLYVLFKLSEKYSPRTNEGALHTLRPNHNLLVVSAESKHSVKSHFTICWKWKP